MNTCSSALTATCRASPVLVLHVVSTFMACKRLWGLCNAAIGANSHFERGTDEDGRTGTLLRSPLALCMQHFTVTLPRLLPRASLAMRRANCLLTCVRRPGLQPRRPPLACALYRFESSPGQDEERRSTMVHIGPLRVRRANLTIPNALSLGRIVAAPVLCAAVMHGRYGAALAGAPAPLDPASPSVIRGCLYQHTRRRICRSGCV